MTTKRAQNFLASKPGAMKALEIKLARMEEIIRACAVRRERLPPVDDLAAEIDAHNNGEVYEVLSIGKERGMWNLIRFRIGFIEVQAPDLSWRTQTYQEWRASQSEPPRKCLRCRGIFMPPSRFRFMCDPCLRSSDASSSAIA